MVEFKWTHESVSLIGYMIVSFLLLWLYAVIASLIGFKLNSNIPVGVFSATWAFIIFLIAKDQYYY
jgi:hypothetical protein